jgi:hypothetical protein
MTHSQNQSQQKQQQQQLLLKVNTPIFVLNLPKSGTTTIWRYFQCGLGQDRAVHWWTTQHGKRIGSCIGRNVQFQKPPLQGCGDFDVWIDFGNVNQATDTCFFPGVHALEALYYAYPNATFLLIQRDLEEWYQSAKSWGKMFYKWKKHCRDSFFPNKTAVGQTIRNQDFKQFYQWHTEHIRQFAREHPDMTYLEPPNNLKLSSQKISSWLEEHIGISAQCWGKCQPDGHSAICTRY